MVRVGAVSSLVRARASAVAPQAAKGTVAPLRLRVRPFSVARTLRAADNGAPRRRANIIVRAFRLGLWTAGFALASGVGYGAVTLWAQRYPQDQKPADPSKKKLVILGTGWGSVSLLKTLDTANYDVTIVSPRNYFLFTPLLPSCSTGNVEHRSIMEPVRYIMRGKTTESKFIEGECTAIDAANRKITVRNVGAPGREGIPVPTTEIGYDLLVVGVGSEVSTYGIPGVKEHGLFMKEIEHAHKARQRIMDCVEAASFPGLPEETRKRLLHAVVVGGGPTGVEFAGELHDFFEQDLRKLSPNLAPDFKVTLVEALPNVLPSFSKHLISYTEKTLADESIEVLTKTAVKEVTEDTIYAEQTLPDGTKKRIALPYGMFVWAGGNRMRPLVKELIDAIPEQAGARRGLLVDEYLAVKGAHNIWALGDCTASHYAPTAQVAAQEGVYLGQLLNRRAKVDELEDRMAVLDRTLDAGHDKQAGQTLRALERRRRQLGLQKTFQYSHQGSLAYVGSEKAVADLAVGSHEVASAGSMTYLFWRSAYVSMSFSLRNKVLVLFDWFKVRMFGRDVSRE